MIEKLTNIADYLRRIPAAFLVAMVCALGLILFLPAGAAKVLAVDKFRETYRIFLGPAFLLIVSFLAARIFMFCRQKMNEKRLLLSKQKTLHKLTPEEKGYLVPYIIHQKNTLYVGPEDGIMNGLVAKGITYRAASIGNLLDGIAFNLRPWAREYLENNPHLLDGAVGQPMTPRQKLHSGW